MSNLLPLGPGKVVLWLDRGHENQLQLWKRLLGQSIGLGGAHGIVPSIKTGDLADQRSFGVDPLLAQHLDRHLTRQVRVAWPEWIDGGRNDACLPRLEVKTGIFKRREHDGVVMLHVAAEKVPHLWLRIAEIQMAMPDP